MLDVLIAGGDVYEGGHPRGAAPGSRGLVAWFDFVNWGYGGGTRSRLVVSVLSSGAGTTGSRTADGCAGSW